MKEIVPAYNKIAPATRDAQDKIDKLAEVARHLPQIPFVTEHLLHGGMYTRTVMLPAEALCTAVLIVPPTVLITMGDVEVWSNDEVTRVIGYTVTPGSAGRKIAFITHSITGMSMIFPCTAKTVEEAEEQFTTERESLVPLSQSDRHRILITGE